MRRRLFIFFIMAVFLFSQTAVVDARSRGGRSFSAKSFSSKSSSKSWSGSSSSKSSAKSGSSSGGWFGTGSSKSSTGKSGSGSTGSAKSSGSASGRSVPGSYSSGGSKSKTSTANATKKNSYMQDAYKKQASSSSYKKYNQKLNAEQQKSYDAAMKSKYTAKNRMNFEDAMRTRPSRINTYSTRPIFVNVNPVYFGSPFSYGYAHVGMWDLWFLMRASDLFWYHHWNDITPYRDYFAASQYAEMEARVAALEKQNNGVRDASYLDPGVDPDLQLSDEYQQANPDSVYYTNKYSSPASNTAVVIIIILIVAVVLIVILRKASRAKPKKTYNSRIY